MVKNRGRFAFTPLQKGIIWIAVLLCVWELLQNQTVTTAVLNFCCAGIVPGTHITLTPNQVLRLVLATLGAGATFLSIRPIHRRIKRRTQEQVLVPQVINGQPEQLVAIPISEQSHMAASVAAPQVAAPQKVKRPKRTLRTPDFHWLRAVAPVAQRAWKVCARLMKFISTATTHGMHLALHVSRRFWHAAQAGLVVSARYGATKSIATWRWLVPHLWEFDHWLERQTHRSKRWAAKKVDKHENALFVFVVVGECKRMFTRFRVADTTLKHKKLELE